MKNIWLEYHPPQAKSTTVKLKGKEKEIKIKISDLEGKKIGEKKTFSLPMDSTFFSVSPETQLFL